MSTLITGMDNSTQKQLGENGHTEYSISNNLDEKIVQLFFQLVRNDDHSALEILHQDILQTLYAEINSNGSLKYDRVETVTEKLTLMYKLIGQTRDIISGKGEQKLAFMQIWGFYTTGFTQLACNAVNHLVGFQKETKCVLENYHPYGSWKDIKYFCNYIREKTGNADHELINVAINIALTQLENDHFNYDVKKNIINSASGAGSTEGYSDDNITSKYIKKITLAARWLPREKSKKFGWIFKKMAETMFPHFLVTAHTPEKQRKAILKCRIQLNKKLTAINKYLNTTQINQCNNTWGDIDFNTVTSATLRKQTLAFAYKDKMGTVRGENDDRIKCADNFKKHIEEAKGGSEEHKMRGRRINVYELVKDAMDISCQTSKEKLDTINLQWEDNKKNNKGLGNIIPCSDTSYSMTVDNNTPLYNSIGLGIRVSELTHTAFKNRVLTFASSPVWHNLSTCKTFVEKVNKMNKIITGINTNFYAALKMILNVIIEHNIPPEEVNSMILAIFSDMQIDEAIYNENLHYTEINSNDSFDQNNISMNSQNSMDTLYDTMIKMYANAGMRSEYKQPYTPPHILFWNLRKTTGFPVLSTKRNVSMLSGYNSTLLNVFCEKGIDALKEFTPRKMLKDILSNERYNIMKSDIQTYLKCIKTPM